MKRIGYSRAQELVSKGAFLVDMRSPVAFRDGHVSGATNLPLRNFLNTIMAMDRKKAIIIYSDGVADEALSQGTSYAEVLGFTNVYVADYKSLLEDSPPPPRPKPRSKKKGA